MRRFTAFVLGLCLSLPVLAEQVQRFGDLDVHYNVFNSSFLQPNVASAVGLVRSKAQGVINVVPMEKGKPVEASVTGSANAFYERAVNQHLRIGIAALDLLRSQLNSLHSRKLRSFDEPPFR